MAEASAVTAAAGWVEAAVAGWVVADWEVNSRAAALRSPSSWQARRARVAAETEAADWVAVSAEATAAADWVVVAKAAAKVAEMEAVGSVAG